MKTSKEQKSKATTATPKVAQEPKPKAEKVSRCTKGLAAYVHGQLAKGKSPEDTIKAAVKTGNWPTISETQCWWDYVIHFQERMARKEKEKAAKAPPAKATEEKAKLPKSPPAKAKS
jgi:hypothetical protein